MLEGLPTVEGNQRLLDGLSSMNVGPCDLPPLVLPARQTSIEWDREKPYPFGTPSALPSRTDRIDILVDPRSQARPRSLSRLLGAPSDLVSARMGITNRA